MVCRTGSRPLMLHCSITPSRSRNDSTMPRRELKNGQQVADWLQDLAQSISFFEPSAEIVAPRLLGHLLIRNTPDGPCGGPIVETEAYVVNDPACHGYIGQTPRNASMYGPAGRAYVYLIYGFHFCVNTVCCPKGTAEAVLVRAIEPAFGEELMRAHRPVAQRHQLTNGPGKLCAALRIDRKLDGVNICD